MKVQGRKLAIDGATGETTTSWRQWAGVGIKEVVVGFSGEANWGKSRRGDPKRESGG